MRREALLIPILSAALLAAPGCGKKGSGVRVEEAREVEAFEQIEVEGSLSLEATVGGPARLVIIGDDNLVPLVKSRVSDGTLHLEIEDSYRTDIGLKAVVASSKLVGLGVSGAAKAAVEGITGDRFDLDVSGAAQATLSGKVAALHIDVSGAARVAAEKLQAQTVDIKSSGASQIDCHATEKLTADVSGAGKIGYLGTPAVHEDISGAASVGPL